MSLFVEVKPDLSRRKARMVIKGDSKKTLVRSHVMKSYIQKQIHGQDEDVDKRAALASDLAWRLHRRKAHRPPTRKPSTKVLTPPSSVFHDEAPASLDLAPACIQHIISFTHVYRSALLSNFVDAHFPGFPSRNTRLEGLLSAWTSPSSPTMEKGNDALGLLQLGGAISDRRLTQEGHRRYICTLQQVRQDVEAGTSDFQGLFAAVQDLLGCEMYKSVSHGLTGWQRHIVGINSLARSQAVTTLSPDFGSFLKVHFHHYCVIYALATRSSACLPQWCSFGDLQPDVPSRVDNLMKIALSLPRLLQQTDHLCSKTEHIVMAEEQQQLDSNLQTVVQQLDSWKKDFSVRSLDSRSSPKTNDRIFFKGHPHFDALALALHKVLLLTVYEAQWSLGADPAGSGQAFKSCADQCAEDLLSYIPHLVASTGGDIAKARAVRAPMFFAIRWYRLTDNSKDLQQWLDLEDAFRNRLHYLDWDAVLPSSFINLIWIRQ